MKCAKLILLRLLTLLADVPGAFLALAVMALWGGGMGWRSGLLLVYLDPRSWPARTWYRGWAGTTIGHAVVLNCWTPDTTSAVLQHELVHVEQHEGFALVGLALGAATVAAGASLWLGVFAAVATSPLCALAAIAVAWLRGEPAYRGSAQEEAAYDAATREAR